MAEDSSRKTLLSVMSEAGAGSGGASGSGGDSPTVQPSRTAKLWRKAKLVKYMRYAQTYRKSTFEYARTGPLSMLIKLSYSAPMLAVTSLTMLISIHGTTFYNKIGLNASFLAFFTAVARSVDVITDPLMGWISDSTRSRFGRRRPYFTVGCVGYAIFYAMLFSPPKSLSDGNASGLVGWFGVFYILYYLFTTLSDVPHGALGPELTDDSEDRNSLYFYYNLFRGVGVLIAAVAPVMVPYAVNSRVEACDVAKFCPPAMFAEGNHPPAFVPADHGLGTCASMPVSGLNSTVCTLWKRLDEAAQQADPAACYCACTRDQDALCSLDSSRLGFTLIAVAFGVYYVTTVWHCSYRIRERKTSTESVTPPIVPSMLMTFRNGPFVDLLPSWICDMTAITMLGTMMPFYMPYVIQPETVPECSDGQRATLGLDGPGKSESAMWCNWETWLGMSLVMLFVANLASMPFWLWVTKKMGKVRTWLFFNLTSALTNGLFIFAGRGDPKLCTFLAAVNGIPAGAQFLTDSILADVIDYDEFLTGKRSEGRFTIFQAFIPKVISIPSQAIPLALLAVMGFKEPKKNGELQDQTPAVRTYIQVVFYVLPFILMMVSFLFKLKYPIKNQATIDKIQEGVALHMQGQAAEDPLQNGRSISLFKYTEGKELEEEKTTWKYDHFFLKQLRTFVDTSKPLEDAVTEPVRLVKGMRSSVIHTVISFVVCLTLVIFSIAAPVVDGNTLIYVPTLSWIPIFSVIGVGLSLGLFGFNYIRYKTAQGLQASFIDGSLDRSLIYRWVQHLEGDAPGGAINSGEAPVKLNGDGSAEGGSTPRSAASGANLLKDIKASQNVASPTAGAAVEMTESSDARK